MTAQTEEKGDKEAKKAKPEKVDQAKVDKTKKVKTRKDADPVKDPDGSDVLHDIETDSGPP